MRCVLVFLVDVGGGFVRMRMMLMTFVMARVALVMTERHALPGSDGRHALQRHDERYDGDEEESSELHDSSAMLPQPDLLPGERSPARERRELRRGTKLAAC